MSSGSHQFQPWLSSVCTLKHYNHTFMTTVNEKNNVYCIWLCFIWPIWKKVTHRDQFWWFQIFFLYWTDLHLHHITAFRCCFPFPQDLQLLHWASTMLPHQAADLWPNFHSLIQWCNSSSIPFTALVYRDLSQLPLATVTLGLTGEKHAVSSTSAVTSSPAIAALKLSERGDDWQMVRLAPEFTLPPPSNLTLNFSE